MAQMRKTQSLLPKHYWIVDMVCFSPFLIQKNHYGEEKRTSRRKIWKNTWRGRGRGRLEVNRMWLNNQLLMQSSVQLLMQSSVQLLQPPTPALPPKIQCTAIKQCYKFSRRELTISTNSSLALLLGSQILEPLQHSRARAEDVPQDTDQVGPEEDDAKKAADLCGEQIPTQRAFLEVSIDGTPAGRIVIGLYGDSVPFGAARFSGLVSGAAGITYRRKEFVKITPSYVQHGGVRSYGVDAELARKAGSNLATDTLMNEWEQQYENCPGTKNLARSIGIVVRDPSKPPPKLKLVAREGKLEIDQEEVGTNPNGTEFVISIKDSPELDASTLVVGKVLEGMEVVEKIGQVKTVQENTSSPYFRVAKLIGDKRAVVAERGFNRPYSKVLITNCGLMQ